MQPIKYRNLRPYRTVMKRIIEVTEDGSHTLFIPGMDEHFHSVHGAIQESMHVFIENGLRKCQNQKINILEIGFGTGLNALLSLLHKGEKEINYFSLEKYPLNEEEFTQLNYAQQLNAELQPAFLKLHQCEWNHKIEIIPEFHLTKIDTDLTIAHFSSFPKFDLVYFDAFAPNKQPEMWTDAIFNKISAQCNTGAIFTTYCAKGDVRRSLQQNGYHMQRIPGPPGKKQMLFGEKA